MRTIFKIIFLFSGFTNVFLSASGQEVRARVNGLETDSVYMALLTEELRFKVQEDSLMTLVRKERERFATDTANFQLRSQQILQMEESLFGIRNKLGIVASKINHIEQEFILNNLSNPNTSALISGHTPSTNYRNLIDNDYFKDHLSAEEYRDLKNGDRYKAELEKIVEDYKNHYSRLEVLERAYNASTTQTLSDSIYSVYQGELASIRRLESDFKARWDEQYNQEIYIYSYLLDKLNRMSDLAALNEKAINRRMDGEGLMSEIFAEYPLQKDILIDYELALAGALNLSAAKDSLTNARRRLVNENLAFPEIRLTEKEYVRYEFVSFPDVSPYNSDHPIPELEIPELGTYYSVTVGTFSQRQPVSLFRGAVPVYYEKLRNGQWRYYIGMFRGYGDAIDAAQELKNEGFRRPEPVRWTNRSYENLAASAAKNQGYYRVIIASAQNDLPEEARFLLNRYARSKEITRVGKTFYVGGFTDKLHAEEVVGVLEKIDGLNLNIEEIEE